MDLTLRIGRLVDLLLYGSPGRRYWRAKVLGWGVDEQGFSFTRKGDELVWLWKHNREGTRDPILSISWGKTFGSLKELDRYNQEFDTFCQRSAGGDRQITEIEDMLDAAQQGEDEPEEPQITFMVDAADVEKLQAELAQTKAQLRELALCSQHALQELDRTLGANVDLLRGQLASTEAELAISRQETERIQNLVADGWQHPGEVATEINRLKKALCEKVDQLARIEADEQAAMRALADAGHREVAELARLKADEMNAMEALDYGADDSRWAPGTSAVQALILENQHLRQQTIRGLHGPAEIEAELDRLVAEVHAVRQEHAKTAEAADDFHEAWVDAADHYSEMKDMHDALVDELDHAKGDYIAFTTLINRSAQA